MSANNNILKLAVIGIILFAVFAYFTHNGFSDLVNFSDWLLSQSNPTNGWTTDEGTTNTGW